MRLYLILLFLGIFIFVANQASAAEIVFRNDLDPNDKGHKIRIQDVRSRNGAINFRHTIEAGEVVTFPGKNIVHFVAIRLYDRWGKAYEVRCPAAENMRVKLKLIDIHTNRIAEGCSTVRFGKWTQAGGIRWGGEK